MKYVPVGTIVSAHGVKGEIRFRYYNDEKGVLNGYTSFFVKSDDDWLQLHPTGINFHKGIFRIKFKGLDTIEDVSFLINRELYVKEGDLPGLDVDEYYEYQLIGLDVRSENDESLGTVSGIIRTGANDCLVVKGDREVLVPMTEDHILAVDMGNRVIRVRDWDYPS